MVLTRLYADVYDAAGERLGAGPVPLLSASVTRGLDGVGSISLAVPGKDARAISLLQNERHVRIYQLDGGAQTARELGRGVIRKLAAGGSASDWALTGDGPDDLDALTRVSVLLGRKYSASSVSTIASSLVGLVSGWTASASGGNTTDARFDGVSVLKALLAVCEQQGLHLRAGDDPNEVEIGAFGTDAGLRLVNPRRGHAALYDNDDVALIESISVDKSSEAVCTRLFPLGAGIGEAWLTLEDATRSTPYTVQSTTGPDGQTLYYIEDSAATSAFGQITKVGKFSNIAPLSNSAADMENAANALYDIAAAWLTRHSQRQDVYSVTCRKVRTRVRPGDKVRLAYRGVVTRNGVVVDYLDIDDDFWVMSATESAGVGGATLALKLSTVDAAEQTTAKIVIGALEELQLDGVSVKPYFNRVAWVYDKLLAPLVPATVPVKLSNATQRLNRCILQIKTSPFVSTVEAINVASPHTHLWATDVGEDDGPYEWVTLGVYAPGIDSGAGGFTAIRVPMKVDGLTDFLPLSTSTENETDFVTLSYGLFMDDVTPEGIRVFIDGTDYTSALGGPWAPSGGETTITLDITAQILANPPLQGSHPVRVECTTGRGALEITVEVYETIQSIRV